MKPQEYLKRNLKEVVLSLPEPHAVDTIDSVGLGGVFLNRSEAFYLPSPRVMDAISKQRSLVNRYPDGMCVSLRHKLTDYVGHGITPEQIIIGNGSDGLIELLVKTFVAPQDEVIVPEPSFFVYDHGVWLMGGNLITDGRVGAAGGFQIDTDRLLESVTERTRLIFLANPNNPTGTTIDRAAIETILREAKCMVVVDECYFEMYGKTVIDLIDTYGNLIILRSLSKSFALAGLRVGYCLSNAEVISALNRADQTFPVNRFAQAGAFAALEDVEYMRANVAEVQRLRTILAEELSALGFRVYPSAANFLLVNWGQVFSTNPATMLEKQRIYVADFHEKQKLETCFRVAIGTLEENRILVEALRQALV
jgi:histidinol-phosphate aminotransferase